MLLVFSGVFTFLVDAYPLYAASALAANSFVRSSFAAAFPLFGVQSKSSRRPLAAYARHRLMLGVSRYQCIIDLVGGTRSPSLVKVNFLTYPHPVRLPVGDSRLGIPNHGNGAIPVRPPGGRGRQEAVLFLRPLGL